MKQSPSGNSAASVSTPSASEAWPRPVAAAVVIGLAVAAIVTRFLWLGDWSLDSDEYFTVLRAHERSHRLINPAGYALVEAALHAFGRTEWSARLPSAVLGSLTVPLFYATWRHVFGRWAAMFGAMFLVFSAWHLWYSQFSRFYAGVFLFGSLSYYAYLQALRHDRLGYLAAALAFNVTGFFFHATSVMVAVSCGLFSVIVVLWPRGGIPGFSRRIALWHLGIGLAAGLIAAPFLWGILVNWQGSGWSWGYGPALLVLQISKYLQMPIMIGALLGLALLYRDRWPTALFLTVGLGVPALFLVAGSVFVAVRPDYGFYAIPLAFVLAGVLCAEVGRMARSRPVAAFALPVIIVFSLLPEFVSHYTARRSLDYREVVRFVEASAAPEDKVAAFGNNFAYYAKRPEAVMRSVAPPYSDETEWDKALDVYLQGPGRTWLVLPVRRRPLAPGLEHWLTRNAALVWRKSATRYDYSVEGYEVFVTKPR